MNINKDWDLNIFFKEDYDVYTDESTWDDVLTINPVVYSWDDERSDVLYTDIIFKTTFAEARYIRSQYPEDDYGSDWTDSLENFLLVAPPRIKSLLGTLPDPYEYKLELVG